MRNELALIPAAGWLKGFEIPRALVSLGRELVIERLLRQLGELEIPALVAYGGQGWRPEHTHRLLELDFPCLSSTFVPENQNKRRCVPTILEMLEKVLKRSGYWNLTPESRLYVIPGDFIFASSLLEELSEYPAPCSYCFKRSDPSVILTLPAIPGYLKIAKKKWGLKATIRQGRAGLTELGFSWMEEGGQELGRRFWELDLRGQLGTAKELVLKWDQEEQDLARGK